MKIDFENISAADFGHQLRGFGINMLVRDVAASCAFLTAVLEFQVMRQSADFAIAVHQQRIYQLHADHTYAANPLPALLPENGARGAGIELRLFEVDPEQAEARARALDYVVLQATTNKPHGLRECFLLDPDGYCWVASTPFEDQGQ